MLDIASQARASAELGNIENIIDNLVIYSLRLFHNITIPDSFILTCHQCIARERKLIKMNIICL
jgi:hypothetical protein